MYETPSHDDLRRITRETDDGYKRIKRVDYRLTEFDYFGKEDEYEPISESDRVAN